MHVVVMRVFSTACLTDIGKKDQRPGVDVVEEMCEAVAVVRFRYVPLHVAERAVRSNNCKAYLEKRGYKWIKQHFEA